MLAERTRLGKTGEHLVCADLLKCGYIASIAPEGLTYDVGVDTGCGILKIQVKTTGYKHGKKWDFKLRHTRSINSLYRSTSIDLISVDLIACVADNIVGYFTFENKLVWDRRGNIAQHLYLSPEELARWQLEENLTNILLRNLQHSRS